ncbi:MAG TPA: Gfo/Idh/MocA family oxidoreductase [Ktedonosporobacter sp.]|nr:Gfo/Idh/MocA family oxidoreductase [Ktedonosporobacter sp.]
MRRPRIGMVGLGSLAQKAYLPLLTIEKEWIFAGAYSPTASRRKAICQQYRVPEFASIAALIEDCDAVFVHSSTASHFEVVSELLRKGKDVYVDKPLAATLTEAEKLVELSQKGGRKLMVGFNRRFAPLYVEARGVAEQAAWIRIEKHRVNQRWEGPPFDFTMLDDYIHIVDLARWLGQDPVTVSAGRVEVRTDNRLMYAYHSYQTATKTSVFTAMHRSAGTNLELLEIVTEGNIVRVKNLETMEVEANGSVVTTTVPSWETTLKSKGFEDAVAHFIGCIVGDTTPAVDGAEGLRTQRMVHEMLHHIQR